jgi:hypothetical protein
MDGDRSIGKNQWVQDFVLLPEAGTRLHPAHRIRDQMIAVHLEDARGSILGEKGTDAITESSRHACLPKTHCSL